MSESRKEPDPLPGTQPVSDNRKGGRPPALNVTAYGLARLVGYKPPEAAVIAGSTKTGKLLGEQARRQEKNPEQVSETERLRHADGTLEAHVKMTWPRAWLMCQPKLLAMLSDPQIGDNNALTLIRLIGQLTGNLEQDGVQVQVVQVAHVEAARERILAMQADPDVQKAALKKLQAITAKGGRKNGDQ